MGRWVTGQWVKWVTFWMGHAGHGSVHVDPRPTIISSAQQVTVKYRQKFTVTTDGSLWIMIFQHSVKAECYTSVLHAVYTTLGNRSQMTQKTDKSQLLKREFLKVHNTKYLSVKCAVLMHLSFTCIMRMTDFGVVSLSLHVSNVKCDGS